MWSPTEGVKKVTVTVTDTEEEGSVSLTQPQPQEGDSWLRLRNQGYRDGNVSVHDVAVVQVPGHQPTWTDIDSGATVRQLHALRDR